MTAPMSTSLRGSTPPIAVGAVIDSYPLSPMQEGMVFNSLAAPESGVDIEQLIMTLPEELSAVGFRWAWEQVVGRHDVLRTAFRWDSGNPLQDVYCRVAIAWQEHQWTN